MYQGRGQGGGVGRGSGRGIGKGRGQGQGIDRGSGRGMGNPEGQHLGPSGVCACPKCGFEKVHKMGVKCMDEKCPNCGSVLLRKGGTHYKKAVEKFKKNRED